MDEHAASPPSASEEQPPAGRTRPPMRMLQVIAVAAVTGMLALLVWRLVNSGGGTRLVSEIQAGKKPPAPAFALPVLWSRKSTWPKRARRALADGTVSLGELRGYPVVLNFWASWCVPCKDEAPRLAASARRHAGRVVFLGIDIQDFKSDGRHFLQRFHTPYVSVRSGSGSVENAYGLTGLPETYWLDARGRVMAHYAGEVSSRQVEQGVAAAVNSK